jgi:ATP-dependent 26S proteasome regulatory subunit
MSAMAGHGQACKTFRSVDLRRIRPMAMVALSPDKIMIKKISPDKADESVHVIAVAMC